MTTLMLALAALLILARAARRSCLAHAEAEVMPHELATLVRRSQLLQDADAISRASDRALRRELLKYGMYRNR